MVGLMVEMIRADDSLEHFHKVGSCRTAEIVVPYLLFVIYRAPCFAYHPKAVLASAYAPP